MRIASPTTAAARWRAALIDPASSNRTVLLALAFYVVLWTIYGTIAKGSQGLHPDMTELIAWSRDLSFGYLKHPPLAAWLVRGWFTIFPVTESSYYLLAMLMPAAALWFAWIVSADYLDIEKRVVGLVLLTLIPFFNFHALKFNVNTVLMPLWAATTFWFLRSYRSRSRIYAVLAGVGAGACMLGKYWSVVLLAGLFIAALIDKRRADYFRSAAPYITALAGLAVLAPHLAWLARNDFAPFRYALGVHGDKGFGGAVFSVVGYLGGSFGYVALPVVIVLIAAVPRWKTLADMAWPADTERRLAAAVFWGGLLTPVVIALASGTDITSLWSMPAWTLLPVLLLSPSAVTIGAIDTRRLLIGAAAVPIVALLVSPAVAIIAQRAGPLPASAHAEQLAAQVDKAWSAATPQPLRFVGGETDVVYGIITYASGHPRALPGLTRPGEAELAQAGQAIGCFAQDNPCRQKAAGNPATEIEIVRNYLGFAGKPQRYTIFVVAPGSPATPAIR
ncbi:MAG: glycosyltransferase family 39 protein [Pseudolabrys sp.]